MKTKAAQRLASAVVVSGILTALAWGANAQEPAASAATPATTPTSGGAVSVTTSDGKVFADVKLLKVRGDQALLSYSDGMAWITLDSLSDDARKSLGLPTRQEQTEFEEKVSCHPGLPRLRGVTVEVSSWISHINDDDLRVLGTEWKANVMRCFLKGAAGVNDLAEYDRLLAGDLNELDKILDACRRYRIKLVVDVVEPGKRYPPNLDTAMLYESQYQDHLVATWEKIARRYKGNPTIWAYNPISEPVQTRPLPKGMPDCTGAQARVAKAIRAIDPDVAVFIEVAPWDMPGGFGSLRPVAVSNVIYQVHMYQPMSFTCQGIQLWEKYFPTPYPGKVDGKMWDKEQLRKELQPVRDFQIAHNAAIYVGEFSALRWAPGACNWLRDCIDLFEEYGWDWTYHCYRDWDGWSVEHSSNMEDHQPTKEPTDREKLLLSWFAKNVQPAREVGAPAKQ